MAISFDSITNFFLGSSAGKLTSNFNKTATEFSKVIYRDGSNVMQGPLDMNSNRLLNIAPGVGDNDAANIGQVKGIAATISKGDKGDKGDPGQDGISGGSVSLAQDFSTVSTMQAPSTSATAIALATKPDRIPTNAYSVLSSGYADAIYEYDAWIWDTTNNRLRHTSTDVGGPQFGVPDDKLVKFCLWMAWQGIYPYYEGWRLATSSGDTALATFCSNRFKAEWEHIKASYTPSSLKSGDNLSGNGGWVAYVLDDAGCHLRGLHAVADIYGSTSTEGQTAIGYMVEFLPTALQYFRDNYSTNPLIDYGVSTPAGVPFKSNTYGALYGHPGDTAYPYSSSSYEAWIADEALWLSKRVGSGASAPTAAMGAALQAYAKNTWQWLYTYLRTPLSAGDTRTATGLYASALCLDPNAAVKNTNTSVNGGNSFNGKYDTNVKFHVALNWFYGTPIRAVTSLWDSGTQGMAALSGGLSTLTGADPKYAAEALSIVAAYCAPNGFGRTKEGISLIGNLQDPHSAGFGFPRMMRSVAAVPGFDRSSLLVKSLINTGRKLLATRTRGRITPDWPGEERNFVHDGTGNPDYGWEQELAAGGNGVQAHRDQIMVSAGGLNVIQAALQFTDVEATLGSGLSKAAVLEQILSMLTAARMSGQEAITSIGGNILGLLSFGNGALRLGMMQAMGFDSGGNRVVVDANYWPTVQLNDTTYIRMNLNLARIELWIAGKVVFYVGADGSISLPGGENAAGDITAGGKVFAGGNSQLYLGNIYGYPGINLGSGNYLLYNASKSRLELGVGGQTAATLDMNGNLRIRGNLVQNLSVSIDN